MNRTRAGRRVQRTFAATLLALGVALAACGGGGGANDGVASLDKGDAKKDQSAEQPSSQDGQDAALAYAKCMRDNGVDMPDPQVNEDGQVSIAIGGPAGSAPDEATADDAAAACRELQQKMINSMPKPSPEDAAKARDQMLAFAKCLREAGIDVADPTFDADGRVTSGFDGVDTSSPEYEAATKACSAELGIGGGGASVAIPRNG